MKYTEQSKNESIMKITIAIPVYNEEKTIEKVIDRVKQVTINSEKEIIVVDDGSKDKSYDIIRNIAGIKVIRHEKNQGKGAAVKSALKHATGEVFLVQDADLELDPIQIPNLVSPIIEGKAQVVYGSRNWNKNKKDGKRSLLFYFGGIAITLITNFLFNLKITDEPCGYKVFKTSILRSINIKNDRFEWEPEITAKIAKKGINIYEVPVFSSSRSLREGKKLRRRDGIKAMLTLIKYRFIS